MGLRDSVLKLLGLDALELELAAVKLRLRVVERDVADLAGARKPVLVPKREPPP